MPSIFQLVLLIIKFIIASLIVIIIVYLFLAIIGLLISFGEWLDKQLFKIKNWDATNQMLYRDYSRKNK